MSLANVLQAEIHEQIDRSVVRRAEETGESVRFFSCPESLEHDFNNAVIAHLKALGFDHCPTAIEGTNAVGDTDPFNLRPIIVGFEGRPFPFDAQFELEAVS